jgi:hypothetical protein
MAVVDPEVLQLTAVEEEINMSIKLLLGLLFLSGSILGQNETDLYRFSRTAYNGSARFEAMGGSFGALGADISSSQINPAGFGRFSTSQVGLSVYGGNNSSKSTFNETITKDNAGIGGLSNFAVVITEDVSEESRGILYKQFGFGMNRIDHFTNNIHYRGQQYSSLLDDFTGQANGVEPEYLNYYYPFSTFMAYETYALNYDSGSQSYYSLLNSGDVIHDRLIESKGGQTELFLSYSVNYLNKLYVGANVGFKHHKYSEFITHREELTDTSGTSMRAFEYSYDLTTKGWGANLKIGAIYLFSESFRVGLAVHTPTFSELTDVWSANMSTEFVDSISTLKPDLIPTGNYKYKIRNPFKLIGSVAYVFGTRGCMNIDAEFIDYRMAHFRSTTDEAYSPYNYKIENDYAKTVFKPAVNLRIGGEFILMSTIYVRGGVGYYGRAFKALNEVENSSDLFLSGGFGLKSKKYQMDIAYKHRVSSKNYYAFTNSTTLVNQNTNQVTLSLAFFF